VSGKLPNGWCPVTLCNLIEPSKEKVDPKKIKKTIFVGLEHIESDKGNLNGYKYSDEIRSTKTVFYKGDILYGKLRPYLNKVWYADFDGICSTDIFVFSHQKNLNNKFLKFLLLQNSFVGFASKNVSGVHHPRVSYNTISEYQIGLPPFPEQHRLVAKIEELFTKLDTGVEALKQAQAQLKRYRQSVLKAAVEGKLTAEWREQLSEQASKDELEPADKLLERILKERREKWEAEQLAKYKSKGKKPHKNWREKYKEPTPPNTTNLPELPEGWDWANVTQIGDVITGTTPNKSKPEYYGSGFPFYKPTDLNTGYFVKESSDSLTIEGINNARLLPANSILVTCIGATIGKTGLIKKPGASNQQINAIIPKVHINPKFIYFLCISPFFQSQILSKSSSTTLPILNKSKFEKLALMIPPYKEQEIIVSKIEHLFSIIKESESIIDIELKRAQSLFQSILKCAFEGKLVPQDPNDLPASVLLERIKSEKSKSKKSTQMEIQ